MLANFSTMTGYVCIKDFDHVSIEENSVVVAAAAHRVTDLRDRYKEGCVLLKKSLELLTCRNYQTLLQYT